MVIKDWQALVIAIGVVGGLGWWAAADGAKAQRESPYRSLEERAELAAQDRRAKAGTEPPAVARTAQPAPVLLSAMPAAPAGSQPKRE